MDYSIMFDKVKDSVLDISIIDGKTVEPTGSGILIGDGTKALTCAHCVSQGKDVLAKFSGSSSGYSGTIEYFDSDLDIALIKFEQLIGKGVLMKNSDSVRIGNDSMIVGFPLMIHEITLLTGNIAGFYSQKGKDYSLIRINASVNHGNSGGPLFNMEGELIGVINSKHNGLSPLLEYVEKSSAGTGVNINFGGVDVVKAIKELIRNMSYNMNLGIGYAIPVNAIGARISFVKNLIK